MPKFPTKDAPWRFLESIEESSGSTPAPLALGALDELTAPPSRRRDLGMGKEVQQVAREQRRTCNGGALARRKTLLGLLGRPPKKREA